VKKSNQGQSRDTRFSLHLHPSSNPGLNAIGSIMSNQQTEICT
jgi:hypothetical protein